MIDSRLASYLQAKADPASLWPGAPPNFGQIDIEHVFTVSGQTGLAGRAYLNADEAMMHDPSNAERMKVDCGVCEPLEARQRMTALLKWSIKPEIEEDEQAKELAKQMTLIINRTPRFVEFKRSALEAIWTGKSGIAMQFASELIGNERRIVVSNWEPRHGDKLVFRYDDGSHKFKPGQVGIRVGTSVLPNKPDSRNQIEYTSQGLVYWLSDQERKRFLVHKHMIEDGPFDRPNVAGRIHGVGVRSRIYWTWYGMVEMMAKALEYLDRAAQGVEIWRYPANNPSAKAKVEAAAKRHLGSGRSIVLVPVMPGEQAELYGVEHVEPGLAGVDRILTVIKELFQNKMKRYILGQILSSEAEATGLGSGVADAHLATLADIISYDASNLEETLSNDLLRPLQLYNFPHSYGSRLKFVLNTEDDNVQEKLQALKQVWDMGGKIREQDLADCVGIAIPVEGEKSVFNPQIVAGIQQMQQQVAVAGSPVDARQQMVQVLKSHLGVQEQQNGPALAV